MRSTSIAESIAAVIVREATGLSATDRDAAVARCERELRDHGSSWNLLVAVAGLYTGWATTARAAGEEGAAAVLVEVMCMVNLADDAEEIARLAERGEEARSALGWALADADPVPSLRVTAAARLLELEEEAAAHNQLEVIAGEQQGDNTTRLACLLLGDESPWRDESLADRRLALLGRMQA